VKLGGAVLDVCTSEHFTAGGVEVAHERRERSRSILGFSAGWHAHRVEDASKHGAVFKGARFGGTLGVVVVDELIAESGGSRDCGEGVPTTGVYDE